MKADATGDWASRASSIAASHAAEPGRGGSAAYAEVAVFTTDEPLPCDIQHKKASGITAERPAICDGTDFR
jgi:hypothetical protein